MRIFSSRPWRRLHLSALLALLPASTLALSDSQLLAARDAYRKNDLESLAQLASQANGGQLDAWPRYWHALRALDGDDSVPLRAFVKRQRGDYLGERAHNTLLDWLAKQQQWDELLRQADELPAAARDRETSCHIERATLLRRQSSKPDDSYLTLRLPEGCALLIDEQSARQLLPPAQQRTRLRLLLAGNYLTAARRLAAAGGHGDAFFRNGSAEQQAQDIARLGKSDVGAALQRLAASRAMLNDEQAGYVYGQLAMAAAKRHNMPQALDAYAQADQKQLTDEQWEWWLRAALRQQDWAAVERISGLLPPAVAAKGAWQYWRARALHAQGRGSEAAAPWVRLSFEHNYYGLLAREELGTSLEEPPQRLVPDDATRRLLADDAAVRQTLALNELAQSSGQNEWREDARRLWRWAMRERSDVQLLAAAELARDHGLYDLAIAAAERTQQQHNFALRYLTPYRDTVRTYARQLEVDEAWVYGLIRQESRFYNVARSGVGASGLMQLMPATAKWVAGKLGLKSYQVNDIDTNIRLGTWYLRYVLDNLGGQPVLATAAYNAGPGRARGWQAASGMDSTIYIETIPFDETRDYVQKVMAGAVYYAGAFRQPGNTLKLRLGSIPPRKSQGETP